MRISRLVPAVLALMLGAQAFAARGVLTPDGVSYLDLAQAVRSGQWSRFINGYWSPLYPLLISAIAPARRGPWSCGGWPRSPSGA